VKVVELLDVPQGVTAAGCQVGRYQRLTLEAPVIFEVRQATVDFGDRHRLELSWVEDEPHFAHTLATRTRPTGPGTFETTFASGPVLTFRVVDAQAPAARWPSELDGLVAGTTPGPHGLEVLGDRLLEQHHPLGARVRQLPDSPHDEAHWLADLPTFEREGRVDLTWVNGMASAVVVRHLNDPGLFSLHVLTHLVEHVELITHGRLATDASALEALVAALKPATLPWLRRLTVHWLAASAQGAVKALRRRMDVVLSSPERVGLSHQGQTQPLAPGQSLTVGSPPKASGGFDGPTRCFVRFLNRTPTLSVATRRLELNGKVRERDPLAGGVWLIPLKVADRFAIDGQAWELVALDD